MHRPSTISYFNEDLGLGTFLSKQYLLIARCRPQPTGTVWLQLSEPWWWIFRWVSIIKACGAWPVRRPKCRSCMGADNMFAVNILLRLQYYLWVYRSRWSRVVMNVSIQTRFVLVSVMITWSSWRNVSSKARHMSLKSTNWLDFYRSRKLTLTPTTWLSCQIIMSNFEDLLKICFFVM